VQIFLNERLVINKMGMSIRISSKISTAPLPHLFSSLALFILATIQISFFVFAYPAPGPRQEAVKSHCGNNMEIKHGSKVNKSYTTG
jgi:hypothetical protein